MSQGVEYTGRERFWLQVLAVAGFVIVNGAFLYGLIFDPGAVGDALSNPVSAAFIGEALILVGVFAYLLAKWQVARLRWGWFVALSIIGSMAFALPVVLLWRGRRETGVAATAVNE